MDGGEGVDGWEVGGVWVGSWVGEWVVAGWGVVCGCGWCVGVGVWCVGECRWV